MASALVLPPGSSLEFMPSLSRMMGHSREMKYALSFASGSFSPGEEKRTYYKDKSENLKTLILRNYSCLYEFYFSYVFWTIPMIFLLILKS